MDEIQRLRSAGSSKPRSGSCGGVANGAELSLFTGVKAQDHEADARQMLKWKAA